MSSEQECFDNELSALVWKRKYQYYYAFRDGVDDNRRG